ncbi:MAG TPA: hypothetical protein DIW23_14350 [Anaerolineae bacterium]|nr:hypothetical protein [Anaerolineae bacterium]
MKKISSFVFILAFSLLLSYLYNSLFLNLETHTATDQFLLVFLLTCSLAWIIYFTWINANKLNINWNFRFKLEVNTWVDNLPGIILGFVFFFIYFYYGSTLNNFGVGQVDNLFDADVASWMRRISFDDVKEFEMRGPHPFTYFIFQPFGRFLNLFTNNPPLSAILFNCLVGSGCVFLAWLYIKRQFESRVYAGLIATLFGLSTSHLFFGSVIDTYIFSAFALILFLLFLQQDDKSIATLIFAGVITFGITLTNFVQNLIAFFISRPKIKETIYFTGWVIAISLLLTFLHTVMYPASKVFFLTPDIQNEQKFFAETFEVPEWRFTGRNMYLARTVLLYTAVAPQVFILAEEVGSVIPEFRFYKISTGTFHQAQYDGLAQILVGIWLIILGVAGAVFFWNLIRTRKADAMLTFVLCLAFNFGIHFFYGQELFLYSADWAYALIFFVAFGLAPFANNRFFQTGMLVFLILLAYHQWQFMESILQSIAKFMEFTASNFYFLL